MSEFVCFLIGLLFGGTCVLILMCCLQINRINHYERKIRSLEERDSRHNERLI